MTLSTEPTHSRPAARPYQIVLDDGTPVVCWLVDFTTRDFAPSAFARHGIALPESVARSVPKRQAEFFHGRLAARQALAQWGSQDQDVGIGPMREPVWPAAFVGSISHSGALAAAAVLPRADGAAIGIDVETVPDGGGVAALDALVVDAAERELLRACRAPFDLLVTIVFSAKESFYKAAFPSVRRFFDFSAAAVVDVDCARQRVVLQLRESLCPQFQAGDRHVVRYDFLAPQTVLTYTGWNAS